MGEQTTTDSWSRAYDANGNTLDYVYEVDEQTLTTWAGQGAVIASDERLLGSSSAARSSGGTHNDAAESVIEPS